MEETVSFQTLVTIYQVRYNITKERIVIKVMVELSLCRPQRHVGEGRYKATHS